MLIRLTGVELGYGGPPLLDGVDFHVERGERVCLVGRNGSGKSTLLRVIAGEIPPDAGQIARREGLRTGFLPQEAPAGLAGSVFEVVAGAFREARELLTRYHRLSVRLAADAGGTLLPELERVQHALESAGGWGLQQAVEAMLTRLRLDADADFHDLSGGNRRRALLARALVGDPDLLLLDEPTNHLDVDSIRWLEEELAGRTGALLFITHDRALARHLATRIVDLDRGRLTDWPGGYDAWLGGKRALLEAEASQQAAFDRRLATEEAWIRRGIEARRTRNQGRVRALQDMRAQRRARRERTGRVRMQAAAGEPSGRIVIEADGLAWSYGTSPVIRDFGATILRGDKVGLIGPNGCGKTTLLRLLLGELVPQAGTVRHGTKLQIAYYDQQRASLDGEASVRDNVSPGSDTVEIAGRRRHIMSYLQDFLFTPERARTPVKALSGGERNRLLLARLFSRPCNVLVLDEPTNDLDVETLELLEELLLDFDGTVLLVTHDRALLDNVVTGTFAFEGDGRFVEYVGGYEDWLRQRPPPRPAEAPRGTARREPAPAAAGPRRERPRKLGYKEQRELESLPRRIQELEDEQRRLQESMADRGFYRRSGKEIAAAKERLEAIERDLRSAYERWETLESGG